MPILKVEMLKVQINTMAILLSESDFFLPIYRADLAGSRTLSFGFIGPVVSEEKEFKMLTNIRRTTDGFWLVGCFGLNGPLRQ